MEDYIAEQTKEIFPGEILLASFTLTFCYLVLGLGIIITIAIIRRSRAGLTIKQCLLYTVLYGLSVFIAPIVWYLGVIIESFIMDLEDAGDITIPDWFWLPEWLSFAIPVLLCFILTMGTYLLINKKVLKRRLNKETVSREDLPTDP